MRPFKALTATHEDGEKSKRFGYKAPTFDAWLEIFLQDEMPDYIVGILLNLNFDEVEELKSCIRHELRFPAVTVSTFDVYYPLTGPNRELLCKKGAPQLGWHLFPAKSTTLIRSPIVLAVALEFPDLFKEPSSSEDYLKEWTPNQYGCYSVVPHHFRRDVLARLVDICAEDMKRDKNLRADATDPNPYKKKSTPRLESTTATLSNIRIRLELSSTDTGSGLGREHLRLE
ncbi:hypothetical protein E4T48_00478 [Aureobasidium sp. EXF-10727]|nr:hypothetical protein E4T48_00478 [Aureobasidium sp. EXF-10727]KAI4729779.1 hypothetical protein E4T49_02531 [Aureobasidium sp. EXF-10728]